MQVFFFSKFLVGLPSLLFCVSFIEQTKQNKTKENNNNNKKKKEQTNKQSEHIVELKVFWNVFLLLDLQHLLKHMNS